MELTSDEFADIFDINCFAGSTNRYTLPPGINETGDLNLMFKSLLPNEEKLNVTIDDVRLRSSITTKKQ